MSLAHPTVAAGASSLFLPDRGSNLGPLGHVGMDICIGDVPHVAGDLIDQWKF